MYDRTGRSLLSTVNSKYEPGPWNVKAVPVTRHWLSGQPDITPVLLEMSPARRFSCREPLRTNSMQTSMFHMAYSMCVRVSVSACVCECVMSTCICACVYVYVCASVQIIVI